MNEQQIIAESQVWWVTILFFLLGHVGFALRIMWVVLTSGQKKLSLVDDYIEENSLVVVFGLVCYYALVALWLWTDALSLLGSVGKNMGLVPGSLNGWTIIIAILSDVLLLKIVDKLGDKMGMEKLSEKISQAMPKLSKPEPPSA